MALLFLRVWDVPHVTSAPRVGAEGRVHGTFQTANDRDLTLGSESDVLRVATTTELASERLHFFLLLLRRFRSVCRSFVVHSLPGVMTMFRNS